jgi:hypothetical protein
MSGTVLPFCHFPSDLIVTCKKPNEIHSITHQAMPLTRSASKKKKKKQRRILVITIGQGTYQHRKQPFRAQLNINLEVINYRESYYLEIINFRQSHQLPVIGVHVQKHINPTDKNNDMVIDPPEKAEENKKYPRST